MDSIMEQNRNKIVFRVVVMCFQWTSSGEGVEVVGSELVPALPVNTPELDQPLLDQKDPALCRP